MRILHITPQPPSLDSGGGIGVYQTIKSLKQNHYSVDYVGIKILDESISRLYDNLFYLESNTNLLIRIWDVLRGITNSTYRSWKKLNLDFEAYDVVVLDFTKLDYIEKKLGRTPLIVKAHNVEYDYTLADYSNNRSLSKKVLHRLSFNQENKILERADKVLVLSQQDLKRFFELYNPCVSKFCINGVCLEPKKFKHSYEKVKLLITGSLCYGANAKGIVWFINNVYSKIGLSDSISLTIAGKSPSEELISLCSDYDSINLIASPIEMHTFFSNANLFIAPIFDGAGMKVKVAEALSYGLPVIGTDFAFIGYDDYSSCLVHANTSKEFIDAISRYISLGTDEFNNYSEASYRIYEKNYSMTASAMQWKKAVESVVLV